MESLRIIESVLGYSGDFFSALQLAQGGNSTKGKEKRITATSEDGAIRFSTSYTFCVVFEKWIFYHMMFSSVSWAFRNLDWEAFFYNLPGDVTADVPIISVYNYGNDKLGGITVSHIEGGYWMLPKNERGDGFENTSNYVFSFGYLIRDNELKPVIEGRLRIQEEMDGGRYNKFRGFDLELIPSPARAACEGSTGIYSASECTFIPQSCPEEMPEFDAFFLDTFYGGQGLSVQLLKMECRKGSENATIRIEDKAGMRNLAFTMYDTAIALAPNNA